MTQNGIDRQKSVVVRRMTEADVDAAANLDKEFAPVSTVSYQGIGRNAGPWLAQTLNKPEWDLFVAEMSGQVVGFGITLDFAAGTGDYLFPRAANTLWVMYLAVAKDCQGRGIGLALYEHAEKIAVQRGRTQLFIDVASDNPITSWYQRLGFREIGGQRYLLKSINDQQHSATAESKNETMTSQNKTSVTLRGITKETVRSILQLEIADAQKRFVASNAAAIAEAHFSEQAWFRAIYAGETPVGFVMLALEPEYSKYYLWRFMIDRNHQHQGYGLQAMRLVIEFVKAQPGAAELTLSYVPGEGDPSAFYQKLGFVETDEWDDDERVMKLVF